MNRARYQQGNLTRCRRADGKVWWILRYRATDQTGKRVQRQHDLGTTDELKTESQVRRAADVYRQQINNRAPAAQLTTVGGLAQHFKEKELREDDDRRSWSTKQNYRDVIDGCILPDWENTRLMYVKSVAIEAWLPKLRSTRSGKPPSNRGERSPRSGSRS